jgi:NitT/TauT family transport system ATP-binding protein
MSPPPVVQLKSVSKRFGGGPLVLDRIDFSAARGEFVSFIGPSGCGKSTLLRLISGLIPLSSGSLEHDGAATAVGEDLAFVFQEPTLLPWLTVARNVELPLKLRGVPAEQRRSRREAALTRVRLSGREEAYPRQLSGGQKMRVSIARALALRPKLLLLDEPFGALDEMTRNHLNEELLAIRSDQDWTAFFVTHSVAEAVFLSSRVVVLSANPGRIHAEIAIPLPYPRNDDTRRSAA